MKANQQHTGSKSERLLTKILDAHRHQRYALDITTGSCHLSGFIVHENVLRPELVTSWHLARFLAQESCLYKGRTAIDMGSGSGIQGVVMAMSGAHSVLLTDNASAAVQNSAANVEHFSLRSVASVVLGDLFVPVKHAVDVVVFNHPFFPGQPIKDIPVSAAIMDPGELIHHFLDEAPRFARKIIMPFFHPAGETNDPGIQAPKHGYKLANHHRIASKRGLHRGLISIYDFDCPRVGFRNGSRPERFVLKRRAARSRQKAILV